MIFPFLFNNFSFVLLKTRYFTPLASFFNKKYILSIHHRDPTILLVKNGVGPYLVGPYLERHPCLEGGPYLC